MTDNTFKVGFRDGTFITGTVFKVWIEVNNFKDVTITSITVTGKASPFITDSNFVFPPLNTTITANNVELILDVDIDITSEPMIKVYAKRILSRLSNARVKITDVRSTSNPDAEINPNRIGTRQVVIALKKILKQISDQNKRNAETLKSAFGSAPGSKVSVLPRQIGKRPKIVLGVRRQTNEDESGQTGLVNTQDPIEDDDDDDDEENHKTKHGDGDDDDDDIEEDYYGIDRFRPATPRDPTDDTLNGF
jgi:hypothetical protein